MAEGRPAPLYSPEMLALAVELAAYPALPAHDARGEAASRTCGSTIAIDLMLASNGTIEKVGLRVSACAVGQAAAAIFARGAPGRSADDIAVTERQLADWLGRGGPTPDWPGMQAIVPAQRHPGRHDAILLPWRAARAALSKETQAG